MDICEMTRLPWGEVEARLSLIQEEHGRKIIQRQFPLLTGMALFFFTAGVLLTGYGLYAFIAGWTEGFPRDLTWYFLPVINRGTDPLQALQPAVAPYFKMAFLFLFSPFSALIIGIAMLAGSLSGMKKAWQALLEK